MGLFFLFYREKGSAIPFPRRPRSHLFLCTHDKVALHCWVLREKTPQITPTFEPATQPSEGYEKPTGPPGRPARWDLKLPDRTGVLGTEISKYRGTVDIVGMAFENT